MSDRATFAAPRPRAAPPAWLYPAIAAVVLACVALTPRPLAQDAPRLLAIERIRRSLAAEGDASPFAKAFQLAKVGYQRPFNAWMALASPPLPERLALRLFMAATTLMALGGLWWLAQALRPSLRWGLALSGPLLLSHAHYMGFLDYNLGVATLPWAIGSGLRLAKARAGAAPIPWIALLVSGAIAGWASPMSALPHAAALGAIGLVCRRGWKRTLALWAGGAVAPLVAMGIMATGGDGAPIASSATWQRVNEAAIFAATCWDPAGGWLKPVFYVALVSMLLGALGGNARLAEAKSRLREPLFKRQRLRGRALGGPVARALWLAAAFIAALGLALPWSISGVAFISTRIFPLAAIPAAFALPWRGRVDRQLLGLGVGLFLLATFAVHAMASRDQANLATVADHLNPGEWVYLLPPKSVLPKTFDYLSDHFAIDEAAALDPITEAGALTPSMYLPLGHFPVLYREEAVPRFRLNPGWAPRWETDALAPLGRDYGAILFMGMSESDVAPYARGRLPRGEFIAGPNWTLWRRAK